MTSIKVIESYVDSFCHNIWGLAFWNNIKTHLIYINLFHIHINFSKHRIVQVISQPTLINILAAYVGMSSCWSHPAQWHTRKYSHDTHATIVMRDLNSCLLFWNMFLVYWCPKYLVKNHLSQLDMKCHDINHNYVNQMTGFSIAPWRDWHEQNDTGSIVTSLSTSEPLYYFNQSACSIFYSSQSARPSYCTTCTSMGKKGQTQAKKFEKLQTRSHD